MTLRKTFEKQGSTKQKRKRKKKLVCEYSEITTMDEEKLLVYLSAISRTTSNRKRLHADVGFLKNSGAIICGI